MSTTYLADEIRRIAEAPDQRGIRELRRIALQVQRLEAALDELVGCAAVEAAMSRPWTVVGTRS